MQDVKVNTNTAEENMISDKVGIFGKLAFYVMLISVFLLPIFVIPLPYANFSFNKNIVFVSAVIFAFLVYLISSLKRGEIVLDKSKFLLFTLGIIAVSILSSISSGHFLSSFFGQGFEVGTTASLIIGFLALWVVPVYFNTKDRVFYAYLAIVLSFAIVALFQFSRLFLGPDFLSMGIFTDTTSNLIGKWYDLGIVFGLIALFTLVASEFLTLPRFMRFINYLVFLISIVLMAIVNFSLSWMVLGLFSLVIGVYIFSFSKTAHQQGFDEEEVVKKKLPIFSIVSVVICALFVLFGSYFGDFISSKLNISQLEVRPNLSSTLSVASNSLSSNILFGSGPNRFVNEWLLHKDPVVNQSVFWSTDFAYGVGLIPTLLVTTGALGLIAWLLFAFYFLKTGFRFLFKDSTSWDQRFLLLSSFLSSLYLWIMNFIYVPSITVFYLTFFVTGLFIATYSNLGEKVVYNLRFKSDSKKSFLAVFFSIIIAICLVVIGYMFFSRYVANILFQKGVFEFRKTGNLDVAENFISKSLSWYENDVYYRAIAEIGMVRINNLLVTAENSSSEELENLRNQFQGVLANTIAAVKRSIEIDPSNYENHVALGNLYSATYQYGVKEAYGLAKTSFEDALKLNPQNPAINLLIARLEVVAKDNLKAREEIAKSLSKKPNYTEAVFLLSQIESSEGNVKGAIESAESATILSPNDPVVFFRLGILKYDSKDYRGSITAFEKAVTLNSLYSNAKYFLGLAYEKVGRNKDAITQFEDVALLNPDNEEVKAILVNIKAGKDPFSNSKEKAPQKRNSLPVDEDN